MTNALYMGSGALTAVNINSILTIVAYIFLAPFIGLVIAYTITILILHICKNARPSVAERWFKGLQLISSGALSFAHGGNDAQKVMGIIYVALVASGLRNGTTMPEWIPLVCYSAIALGTMSGGWKIVKTMGTKITKVTPLEGVSAETAGAITLFITERFGIPVSTTHTITGSIIGVGLTKRVSAVRWGVTVNLIWAWVITIPISALLAAAVFAIMHAIG
jgi:PiT family inorganic phosphate transporter